MAEQTEQTNPLHTYAVHTTGGESLTIKAVRFSIDTDNNRMDFFVSENEKDPNWIVFLHGVAAIRKLPKSNVTVGPRIL